MYEIKFGKSERFPRRGETEFVVCFRRTGDKEWLPCGEVRGIFRDGDLESYSLAMDFDYEHFSNFMRQQDYDARDFDPFQLHWQYEVMVWGVRPWRDARKELKAHAIEVLEHYRVKESQAIVDAPNKMGGVR